MQYVAFKLNTEPEKVFEYTNQEYGVYFNKIEKASYKSFKLDAQCSKSKNRKPNSSLSKIDNETLVLNIVTANLGTDEGESGVTYLFCFKGEELIRVFKVHWIS